MESITRMKLITQICVMFFLSLSAHCVIAGSQMNTVELFAKKNEVVDVKLSPSGKYLGIRRIRDDVSRLVVVDVKSKEVVSHVEFRRREQVGAFHWANDERVIIKILSNNKKYGGFVFYGELYSFDITKNKGHMIFGSRMRSIRTNNTREKLILEKHKAMASSWTQIISMFPNNRDHILIAARPYSDKQNKIPRIYLLNVNNGNISFYIEAPAAHVSYITDQYGDLAFATTFDKENDKVAFEFQREDKSWKVVEDFNYTDWFTPLLYDSNKRTLTFLDSFDKDKRTLFTLDVANKKVSTIFEDPDSEINWVHLNERTGKVLGVEIDTGYPEYHLVKSLKEGGEIFRELVKVFKGYELSDISSNVDETLYSVHVSNDVEPGAWYLYDRKSKKVEFIAKKFEHLDRASLSRTQAFTFKSRDDEKISGHLTLPLNNKKERYPAVLLARENLAGQSTWSYGHTRQMLASLGYAVIEINNRGSTVYGRRFSNLADLHLGDTVQYDLIDGVNYLIEEGIIDKGKICTMGEYIGGYSAIQLSVLESKLFKCAVAKSAFYELSLFKKEWLEKELLWRESRFKEIFGDSSALLAKFSPINYLKKLKSPLLIIHGENEERVSIKQAENLVRRLKKLGKEHVWLELDNERRNVFKEENRREYMQAVKLFLQKYNPAFE